MSQDEYLDDETRNIIWTKEMVALNPRIGAACLERGLWWAEAHREATG